VVDLSQDHCLTNVLELSPRLCHNVHREIVIISAEHANSEPISLRKDHVDHYVVSDHYQRKEKTQGWSFPLNHGKQWDDQG
jgi:hypothetical protein